MIRPYAALIIQTVFVLVVLGGAYSFAMFQGGMVSWTIFYFLLPFSLYSLSIVFYPVHQIEVERTIQKPLLGIGETTTVTLQVKRKNRWPLLYLLIHEVKGGSFASIVHGQTSHLFILGFKREVTFHYELKGKRRGEHTFSDVHIEIADFFGWIKKRHMLQAKGQSSLLLFPETQAVHYVPVGSNHDKGTAKSPFSLMKETTVATSVRDYQPGDRMSWIHWKSFARTQTLMTKEFENKRGEHATLLLDVRNSSSFEDQITFVASILKDAATRNADLTFLTSERDSAPILTVSADGELRKALTQLARLQPLEENDSAKLNYVRALTGAGAIILVSGNPDERLLRPILTAARTQPVYCFVVENKNEPITNSVMENVRSAKSKGIMVQILRSEAFERSFQEVAKS